MTWKTELSAEEHSCSGTRSDAKWSWELFASITSVEQLALGRWECLCWKLVNVASLTRALCDCIPAVLHTFTFHNKLIKIFEKNVRNQWLKWDYRFKPRVKLFFCPLLPTLTLSTILHRISVLLQLADVDGRVRFPVVIAITSPAPSQWPVFLRGRVSWDCCWLHLWRRGNTVECLLHSG